MNFESLRIIKSVRVTDENKTKFHVVDETCLLFKLKGSDRLCKVVELSMQSCGQIL